MIRTIKPQSLVSLWKKAVTFTLVGYAVVTTCLLVKLDFNPVVIGIDAYGTRVITTSDDRLIKKEKENFLKHFLTLQYNYDATSFEHNLHESGDLMASGLWDSKKEGFKKVSEGLKSEPISQKLVITDIRDVDGSSYEADLALEIERRLVKTSVTLRVTLKLKPRPRTTQNPFPYEVESYDEQIIS